MPNARLIPEEPTTAEAERAAVIIQARVRGRQGRARFPKHGYGIGLTVSVEAPKRGQNPVEVLQRQLDRCNFALGVASVASLGHLNPASLLFVAITATENRASAKVHVATVSGTMQSKTKKQDWALRNQTYRFMWYILVCDLMQIVMVGLLVLYGAAVASCPESVQGVTGAYSEYSCSIQEMQDYCYSADFLSISQAIVEVCDEAALNVPWVPPTFRDSETRGEGVTVAKLQHAIKWFVITLGTLTIAACLVSVCSVAGALVVLARARRLAPFALAIHVDESSISSASGHTSQKAEAAVAHSPRASEGLLVPLKTAVEEVRMASSPCPLYMCCSCRPGFG